MRIKGGASKRAGAEGKEMGRIRDLKAGYLGGGSVVKVLSMQT